jgi:hypothetical protein
LIFSKEWAFSYQNDHKDVRFSWRNKMRMEKAVINMVEAARQKDVAPERLARLFEVVLEKVASATPAGTQALKIVQTNLIKDILRSELNAVVRIAKGPRKPRGAPRDNIIKTLSEGAEAPVVAKKPRGRKKLVAAE